MATPPVTPAPPVPTPAPAAPAAPAAPKAKGSVIEKIENLPHVAWQYICTKCHFQSHQPSEAKANEIGISHEEQKHPDPVATK